MTTPRTTICACFALVVFAGSVAGQVGAAGTPKDSASAFIVGAKETMLVKVAFGRARMLGQDVLGNILPYEKVSALGAGAPAEITCPRPFTLGGLAIPAGTFSLWVLPTPTGAILIVNRRIGAAGAAYDSTGDVGRVAFVTAAMPLPVESFTLFFRNDRKGPDTLVSEYDPKRSKEIFGTHVAVDLRTGSVQNLVITWDRFRWAVPVKLQ